MAAAERKATGCYKYKDSARVPGPQGNVDVGGDPVDCEEFFLMVIFAGQLPDFAME